jgi:hypothetical protein
MLVGSKLKKDASNESPTGSGCDGQVQLSGLLVLCPDVEDTSSPPDSLEGGGVYTRVVPGVGGLWVGLRPFT